MTCCAECREKRRNRLAGKRRELAPEKFRKADARRQAKCRAKKALALGESTGPPAGAGDGVPVALVEQLEGAQALTLGESTGPPAGAGDGVPVALVEQLKDVQLLALASPRPSRVEVGQRLRSLAALLEAAA